MDSAHGPRRGGRSGKYSDTMTATTFPQAVLFDHDGTLVDTEPLWEMGKQRLTAAHGGTWTERDTDATLGKPLAKTVQRLGECGVPGSPEQVFEQFYTMLERVLRENPPTFIPGVEPLLRDLVDAGIPAAIVTNATSEVARYTASIAPDEVFRVIIGDEEVARGVKPKPDPDAYLQAARQLGVAPEDCVVIEDSPSGVESGVAAGITTVVVPGVQPVPEQPGVVHVSGHEAVTLDFLRSLADGQ